MRRAWTIALAASVLAWPGVAAADGVSAKMSVDRKRVRVGETLVASFVVSGAGEVPEPELPASLGATFEISGCDSGYQTSIDMFRGVRTQTRQQRCALTPRTTGEFELAFTVQDGNRRIASNTVTVTVVPADAKDPANTAGPSSAHGPVFLWASTDKSQAYVGEQVTYELDIFERRSVFDMQLRTPPSFQDFLSVELDVGEPVVTSVGGVDYRKRPGMRRALFPQRAGTLTIGAAEISLGMRSRERSDPISIEVLPLPAEGQPPGFSPNNVGEYAISSTVDRQDLSVGDPFTLRVTIAGSGNIDVVDPGKWPTIEGVRSYDPNVEVDRDASDVVGGERRYAFLLIPERSGTITIPPYALHYFDPRRTQYATATSEPITLEVAGPPNAEPDAPAPAPTDGEAEPELELAPIFAAPTVPRHVPSQPWLTRERWIAGMVAVPVVVVFGFATREGLRRFGPDEAARARARHRQRRRAQVDAARAALASGKGFHGAVAGLLQDLAVERAGPEGVGLPRPQLVRLLERQGVEAEDVRQLVRLLDRCDEARFGAQVGSADERQSLFDDTLALSRKLERGIR